MEGNMNLDEYFKRIGVQGSFDKLDLATLKLIHKQHVMSVPFENLSIHCGERITMDLEVIFNKIVRSSRGGWCLENNLLFGWVLREMGYDTTTLGARVFNNTISDFSPIEDHLINMVVIDGKAYIADVSFGLYNQLWEPLELISGKDQLQQPGVFCLIEKGDVWLVEKTYRRPKILYPNFAKSRQVNMKESQQRKQIYCFTLEPREVENFSEANQYLQTDPKSSLVNRSICSLQTATGFRGLIGLIYSEVTFKPEEGVDVFNMRNITDDGLEQLLCEKFNVKLQNKLQPVNNKACITL